MNCLLRQIQSKIAYDSPNDQEYDEYNEKEGLFNIKNRRTLGHNTIYFYLPPIKV